MRKLLLIIAFFCFVHLVSAQVNQAIMAHKNGNLIRAKDIVDSLFQFSTYDADAEALYVKGIVYESVFLSADSAFKNPPLNPLIEAYDAYKAAKAITTNKRYSTAAARQMDSSLSVNLLCEGLRLTEEKKMYPSIELLELYLQIKPKDTIRCLDIAIAADRISEREIAKRNFSKLLNSSYKSPFIYKSLYFIYREDKSYLEAERLVKAAKKIYPNDKDLVKMEINLLVDTKKYNEALGKLDTAITLDPDNKAGFLFNIGAIYHLQDSIGRANEYYNKALEVNADYFDANFNLGGIYYEQARKIYEEINAMDYGRYQKSGKRLEEKGHNFARQALPYFEKCYFIDKNNKDVKGFLIDLYRNLKMKDKAKELEITLADTKQ